MLLKDINYGSDCTNDTVSLIVWREFKAIRLNHCIDRLIGLITSFQSPYEK